MQLSNLSCLSMILSGFPSALLEVLKCFREHLKYPYPQPRHLVLPKWLREKLLPPTVKEQIWEQKEKNKFSDHRLGPNTAGKELDDVPRHQK